MRPVEAQVARAGEPRALADSARIYTPATPTPRGRRPRGRCFSTDDGTHALRDEVAAAGEGPFFDAAFVEVGDEDEDRAAVRSAEGPAVVLASFPAIGPARRLGTA